MLLHLTLRRANHLKRRLRPTNRSIAGKPPKNIEDDGYSRYKQRTLWERAANAFQDNPNPGTLIIVRHGKQADPPAVAVSH